MRIQLLGSPVLLAGERRFDHPSRKAMALLAYLAMRADEHISRSHLATLLWGDSGEEQARANLRQTLSLLRKLFKKAGHDPIMVPFDKIVLNSTGIEIDARILLDALGGDEPGKLVEIPAFLEGFSVSAPEFETWMISQRNAMRSSPAHLERLQTGTYTEQFASAAEYLSSRYHDPPRDPVEASWKPLRRLGS
jgi:DNA-binding SARP family transcriptional activator